MENEGMIKELLAILLVTAILSISYIYPEIGSLTKFIIFFGGFLLVIGVNILAKKITAYRLEADIKTKLWEMYYIGFQEKSHFKKPIPMIWLTPLLSLISRGILTWMPILEFEVTPRTERISKRHELYRFANMTEWHIALIVFWGIVANIVLYIALNLLGLNEIAKISLYYSAWSIIPISSLDGSKLLFGSRKLWLTAGILILLIFVWQSMIF